jgi:hypothetical protein
VPSVASDGTTVGAPLSRRKWMILQMVKATCLPRTSKTKNVNARERTTLKRNILLSSQVGPNANVLLFVDLGGIMEEALLKHVLERNPAVNAK